MPEIEKTYAKVILPLAAPGYFTYSISEEMRDEVIPGIRVIVSFGKGNKLYTALVVEVDSDRIDGKTKNIIDCLDKEPILSDVSLDFWSWMADYYMCSIGEVMIAALPGIMNLSSETSLNLNEKIEIPYSTLDQKSKMLLSALERSPSQKISDLSKILGDHFSMKKLKDLIDSNAVVGQEEIDEKYRSKKSEWISLSPDIKESGNVDEVVLSMKRAPKQLQAFMQFIECSGWDGESFEKEYVKKLDFGKRYGVNSTTIKSLVERKVLVSEIRDESRLGIENDEVESLKDLNEDQEDVMSKIEAQFIEKEVVLLQGVTSSGKTEIYVHLIEKCLEKGEQVLYLLPEIALTKQLITRLQQYFGNKITVYHSRMSQEERVEVWNSVRVNNSDNFSIVMGARSSLFLPFENLGLVIIDEEHDRSFKQQDPAPRYMARDSAIVLAKMYGAKVLLGSATPSLESKFNVLEEKYGYALLNKRYGGFKMPEIEVVDLVEQRRKRRMRASFSNVLLNEMNEAFNNGEQVILFQNRRGYAPFLLCDNCAQSPKCVNCDVSLTHHKKKGILLCHQCNYKVSFYQKCKECESGSLSDMGIGTERIEEDLKEIMPEIRTARFDLDSTRKKHAFHTLIRQFENHEIDVLIGTQMVTKGLDFENVGLVGIINADQILRFPDFRSYERAFQMLTQVSGRAGRKKKRGKVVIQSYDAEHPVIQYVVNRNFEGLLEAELKERKLFHYPPFYRMMEIHLKYHDRQILFNAATVLGKNMKHVFGDALLGPEFPYIERIRNKYSIHFILRFEKSVSVKAAKKKLNEILASFSSFDTFRNIKFQFDVDPY